MTDKSPLQPIIFPQKKAHNALSRLQSLLQIREDLLALSALLPITAGHGATSIHPHHHPQQGQGQGHGVIHLSGHLFSSATSSVATSNVATS